MRQVNFKQVVIMSAHRSKIDPVANNKASKELEENVSVLGLTAHEALGVYKGRPEVSYVIPIDNDEQLRQLMWAAFIIHGQESILHQDAHGDAWLHYESKPKELIGKLRATTKAQALKHDGYTVFNDVYYTTGVQL